MQKQIRKTTERNVHGYFAVFVEINSSILLKKT